MRKFKIINCSDYLKLIDELEKNIYSKKQLSELVYEFSNVKADNEAYLKFFEVIDVALSISVISSLISVAQTNAYYAIIYLIVFAFFQLLLSTLFIKKLTRNISNIDLIIRTIETKLAEYGNTKQGSD